MNRDVAFRLDPFPEAQSLDRLMELAWGGHHPRGDWSIVLERALVHVGAYVDADLVGFVHLAWDGRCHAFLLDPTVAPDWQGRGIGKALIVHASEEARRRGATWLHVDYLPELGGFYSKCGFRSTCAGLMDLKST